MAIVKSLSQIKNNDTKWTTIIETKLPLGKNDFSENMALSRSYLLFVWRDFVSQYKQTILGTMVYSATFIHNSDISPSCLAQLLEFLPTAFHLRILSFGHSLLDLFRPVA